MAENKIKVTMSLDAELLRRIDAVAELRDEKRSQAVERILKGEINSEEGYLRDMENPVLRGLHSALTSSPAAMRLLAKAVGEHLSAEDFERIQEVAPKHRKAGAERQKRSKSKINTKEATT
jgi:hypothetical protein